MIGTRAIGRVDETTLDSHNLFMLILARLMRFRNCSLKYFQIKHLVGASVLSCLMCDAALALDFKLGVEPYLGYSQFTYAGVGQQAYSSGSSNTASTNDKTDSVRGTILGGRGGVYFSDQAWLAVDYHHGGPYNLENNRNEYLNRMWGIGIGLIPASRYRLWAGYYFNNVVDDIEHNLSYTGTAIKVSLGGEFRQKLFINFEYTTQSFNSVQSSSTSSTATSVSPTVSVFSMTLSSPLTLN